jgi:hypothetical protein
MPTLPTNSAHSICTVKPNAVGDLAAYIAQWKRWHGHDPRVLMIDHEPEAGEDSIEWWKSQPWGELIATCRAASPKSAIVIYDWLASNPFSGTINDTAELFDHYESQGWLKMVDGFAFSAYLDADEKRNDTRMDRLKETFGFIMQQRSAGRIPKSKKFALIYSPTVGGEPLGDPLPFNRIAQHLEDTSFAEARIAWHYIDYSIMQAGKEPETQGIDMATRVWLFKHNLQAHAMQYAWLTGFLDLVARGRA